MKALFFGSIGTIVETSEIQRQSFNLAFKEAGLNWYWNIATYCDLASIQVLLCDSLIALK